MIIVIRFKYVLLALVSLTLFITILCGRVVTAGANPDGSITVTLISFLPLRTEALPGRLTVASPDPRQRFQVRMAVSPFRVVLQIREKYFPKGYPLTVRLKNLPTWVIGINRSFKRTVLPRIQPEVLHAPPEFSGTRNPLELAFTTPVRAETVARQIVTGFPARLSPRIYRSGQRTFTDYATWRIIPRQPLRHCTRYQILINPQLTGLGGVTFGKRQVFQFTTVSRLAVVDRIPAPGSNDVSLAAPVEATANRKLRGGRVNVAGLAGKTATAGQRISFQPSQVWLPDTEYRASVKLVDQFGEQAGAVWKFRTQKLPAPVWLAINAQDPATITLYHGKQAVKTFKTLRGRRVIATTGSTPQVSSRGYALYSQRLKAGAYYWLRVQDGTLIHSPFFSTEGRIIPEPLAGGGSIQLALADIKWLYQNLPPDTPVIMHGTLEANLNDRSPQFTDLIFFNYKSEFDQFLKESRAFQG